ncbi:MAG: iron ABC transporter [Planctomycetaceae bacterium]|nr:iron ABC transporter [Planctomycetaceae bacterium]
MIWTAADTWTAATAVLAAVACALCGSFLLLRKQSMLGDAISHTLLPGIVVAFVLTSSRRTGPMLIGAAAAGVLTAMLSEWVRRLGRVEASAALGIVFSTLFAVGIIMLRMMADHIDLDPDCVLYGSLDMVALDHAVTLVQSPIEPGAFGLFGHLAAVLNFGLPHMTLTLVAVFGLNVLLITLFYKELKIATFDPDLATTLGIRASVMHYLLVALVAMTVVAAFEAVGSILVLAMLIVPAAGAYLLTDRLSVMLVLSMVIAAVAAVGGQLAAITVPQVIPETWFGVGFVDTTTASMIAVVSGVLFAIVWLISPRHGLISKFVIRVALHLRIAREDMLGLLYRANEQMDADRQTGARDLCRTLHLRPLAGWLALPGLRWRRQIELRRGQYQLTDRGHQVARRLVRSHRLWETYLDQQLDVPVDELHFPAEQLEHVTDPAMQRELAAHTDGPEVDPQGKRVPPFNADSIDHDER